MALINLKDIFKDKGQNFIQNLFTKYVIISEQLDGSRLSILKNMDNSITFCKKDGKPVNFIDRTMMIFYEKAISHFETLGAEVIAEIPDNWSFGFQYFPSNSPVNMVYDRTPHNNLVLTDIQITNGNGRVLKTISDPRILNDWSKKLDVEKPPIIFNGFLDQLQKDRITSYLSTPESELQKQFQTQSFTRFMINILNSGLRTSMLMNDLDKPIEGIVFKFITPGESEVYTARLIDPIFHQHSMNVTTPVSRMANDMYQIAMLDIIEFMEVYDISSIQLNGEAPDERYIELMSIIFNDYIQKNGHKYIGVDFETPDFAKKPEFDINLATIPNERTREILKNSKLNDLFKIIISSFRKFRKNTTPILTKQIVDVLNDIITKIQGKVELMPEENQVLDFNNYLKRSQIENVSSIFESIVDINEALKLNTTERGTKKVNILAGRFQPFTEGHMKVVEQLYKANGLPTFILVVRGGKADPVKNPFDEDTQLAMIGAIQDHNKMVEGAAVIGTAGIDTIYNALRPAYEPVLWGAGTDRLKAYKYQIDKYKEELNALPELDAHEIKRSDEDISATKVREALKIDDEPTFKKMTPKGMHKMYDQLKTIMQEVKENSGYALLSFNDFIVEKNEPIFEASAPKKERDEWGTLYDAWVKGTTLTGVKVSADEGEVLKAVFGGTESAIENIKAMLTTIGISEREYIIEGFAPGDQRPKYSGTFWAYHIKFKKGVTVGGIDYKRGDGIVIVDKTPEKKGGGGVAVIGKKDTTPDRLQLAKPGASYPRVEDLIGASKGAINSLKIPANYKAFAIGLMETIKNNTTNSDAYGNIDKFLEACISGNQKHSYSIDPKLTAGIDQISINNFANDFGEILGAIHLFNVIKDNTSGTVYPSASNAKLVDFYFDGANISSKAGTKGGTASASGFVEALKLQVDAGTIIPTKDEKYVYDNVLLPIVELSSLDFYTDMSNKFLYKKGTGWYYFLQESKLDPNTGVTKSAVIEFLYNLHKNKAKFIKFYKELWAACDNFTSKSTTPESLYKDWDSLSDQVVFSCVMYPLSTMVVKHLNQTYSEPISNLIRLSVDTVQAYLIMEVKKNEIIFINKSLGTAHYHFEPKGDTNNAYSSGIGLSSGAVSKR
jgi:hypothetical protein